MSKLPEPTPPTETHDESLKCEWCGNTEDKHPVMIGINGHAIKECLQFEPTHMVAAPTETQPEKNPCEFTSNGRWCFIHSCYPSTCRSLGFAPPLVAAPTESVIKEFWCNACREWDSVKHEHAERVETSPFKEWWNSQLDGVEVDPSPEEEGIARAAWDAAYRGGFIDGRETGYNTCGSCEHPWYAHTGECGSYMKDGSICGCTKLIVSDPEELAAVAPSPAGESQEAPICDQCKRPYEWNAAVDAYEHDDPCVPARRFPNPCMESCQYLLLDDEVQKLRRLNVELINKLEAK